jgi:uncharacterized membrane protein
MGTAASPDIPITHIGLIATALFLILRSVNAYGDPVRWSAQKSAFFAALSFLNTNKYPNTRLHCCSF